MNRDDLELLAVSAIIFLVIGVVSFLRTIIGG